jgi:hypothetical protein
MHVNIICFGTEDVATDSLAKRAAVLCSTNFAASGVKNNKMIDELRRNQLRRTNTTPANKTPYSTPTCCTTLFICLLILRHNSVLTVGHLQTVSFNVSCTCRSINEQIKRIVQQVGVKFDICNEVARKMYNIIPYRSVNEYP